MSIIIFNEHQRRALEANPNVKTVSNRTIQYTPEFKVKAVKENLQGKEKIASLCKKILNDYDNTR